MVEQTENPELMCKVCLELALDPHTCDDCGQLFCGSCVKQLKQPTCPMCREKDTMKPNKFVKNMIANTKMKCKFDCGQNIEVCNLTKHYESKCPKRNCQCSFCEKVVLGEDFLEHLTSKHANELIAQHDMIITPKQLEVSVIDNEEFKFFEKLDQKLEENGLTSVEFKGAYKRYKEENNNCLSFLAKPEDGYTCADRKFYKWEERVKDWLYQGERHNNTNDGRLVSINKGNFLRIDHMKKNIMHGTCLTFAHTGKIEKITYKDGKIHGERIITDADQKTKVWNYKEGVVQK